MTGATLDMLARVREIMPELRHWFDTVREWYANVRLTRSTVRLVGVLISDPCRLRLTVNHRPLVEGYVIADSQVQETAWALPQELVRPGPNTLVVHLERASGGELLVEAALLATDPDRVPGRIDFRERRPTRHRDFRLEFHEKAEYQSNTTSWVVRPEGLLEFGLELERTDGVTFSLRAGAGGGMAAAAWKNWLEEVLKRVLSRIRKLRQDLREEPSGPRADQRRQDLCDLEAYVELHQRQLVPAFEGGPDTTLEQVIERTGAPDALVRRVGPAPRPSTAAASGSFSCLPTLLILALLAGAGVFFAWPAWQRGEWPFGPKGGNAAQAPGNERIEELLRANKAQSGEVQVSLAWFNKNDLDLHVVCPSGERISFANRQSKCGGRLDVDMNVNYARASNPAVENVFWAKAPRGRYKVHVNHFQNHGQPDCADPTGFTVRVQVRGRPEVYRGEVVARDAKRGTVLACEFDVP